MARDTDRKRVSEAVRLSNNRSGWRIVDNGERHQVLAERRNPEHTLHIRYGAVGQIVEANNNWSGARNGIVTDKRERVLAIIEGRS
jgi:hypothetical protein